MTPLGREIEEIVAAEGPMTVERFMALALGHPRFGYYTTRDPFGAAGDFTTAPEISQMFGELLGLWAVEVWSLMGRPSDLRLVELGPGRGTLMADALRAARVVPDFVAAATVHLVETSPVLREVQRAALAESVDRIVWHEALADVPPGPAIVLANEFFDALPVRQFVRGEGGWHERLVGLGPDGKLAFGVAPRPEPSVEAAGRPGDLLEMGEVGCALVRDLAGRLGQGGGAALAVDYGYGSGGPGETLQAVRRHAFVDPLAEPGEADLTAHVDFAALARAVSGSGATVHGPIGQGDFLRALGIEARSKRLRHAADPAKAGEIDAALGRLTGPGPDGMGELFKVVAFSHPSLAQLPGLPAPMPNPTVADPC